jgi:hypothetical protein
VPTAVGKPRSVSHAEASSTLYRVSSSIGCLIDIGAQVSRVRDCAFRSLGDFRPDPLPAPKIGRGRYNHSIVVESSQKKPLAERYLASPTNLKSKQNQYLKQPTLSVDQHVMLLGQKRLRVFAKLRFGDGDIHDILPDGAGGFRADGIAISRRIYRCAACVQRQRSRRLDHMAVSRKFGELAVNLRAARKMSWT